MNTQPQIPALPPTPPSLPCSPSHGDNSQSKATATSPLGTALDVLAAERDGLAHLHEVYSTNPLAQQGFSSAVDILVSTTQRHGRVIVSGVGKSGIIGQKMIATLNSLGIRAAWLHPTEALHGDLGMIGPHDALILITFSGSTAELFSLMGHLSPSSPVILMTSAVPQDGEAALNLPLFAARMNAIHGNNVLLPTPVPVAEKTLFGVSAPTVSTTVTLALGDALAMAAAHELHEHREGVKDIFKRYHPGGAIGKANSTETDRLSSSCSLPDELSSSASSVSLDGSTIGDMTDCESEQGMDSELSSSPEMVVVCKTDDGGTKGSASVEINPAEALWETS